MEKDYYFVRLPSFERPPAEYNGKVRKVFSVRARSKREAVRNVVVREFENSYKIIFDFLEGFDISSCAVRAKSLLDSISPFDERGRKSGSGLNSMVYFLAGELGSCFGLKPEFMIPYAEEYLATLPNQ
ncbi:MAG: hypothetical protein WC494_01120 [Candidatus Pacearchaeota archaeon]